MPAKTSIQRDVVVVGAGWTGLISAKTYLDLAPDTDLVIVDGGKTVGGVWSKERIYPDLYAQVSHPLFQYSFEDIPKAGLSKDGYISGYTINQYLEDFVGKHGLTSRLQLETCVVEVTRAESGAWVLRTDHGPVIECNKLIWAVGPASSPVLPEWPRSGFSSPVIHSANTGTHLDQIAGIKTATVVGGAKSSFDAVYLLLKQRKKVHWVIREDGAGPLAMAPPTLLGIWNIVDVISTRILASFSPSIMNTSGLWYNTIHQTRLGRVAAGGFWRLVTFLADRAAGYSANEDFERLRPTPHGSGVFWARSGLGTASAPDFWKTLHAGDLTVYRTEIESLSHTDVVNLKNGISVQAGMIISCTGFEKPYRAFSQSLREELGLSYGKSDAIKWSKLDVAAEKEVVEALPLLGEYRPLVSPAREGQGGSNKALLHGPNRHYRRLVPLKLAERDDRSICFPGLVHVIFTPTVCEFQALWTAAYMLGELDLPGIEEREMEVAKFNAWARMRYLDVGRKHSFCIYDYLSYIDTLARDIGVQPARKGNVFTEMFVRYKPADYRGMLDEFRSATGVKEANGKHVGR
ncbi:FAD/NAD(P)-binding domain-containing protein [Colletotrichum zoysiae]|uniref:FAD/NAD(P)-binding domain-containing protein n=1 Tax=Colletotrichum zoysiae TaxID=1216348 RepID=A0AAD9HAE2_9PEZI|nr:FAD/NAD(P)-binding domain-containing protein [Colletotrichum zoysiae]